MSHPLRERSERQAKIAREAIAHCGLARMHVKAMKFRPRYLVNELAGTAYDSWTGDTLDISTMERVEG